VTLVKICGLKEAATAAETAKAGADLIGIMFAQSKRRVTPQECHDIVEAVRGARRGQGDVAFDAPVPGEVRGFSWFGAWSEAITDAAWRWRPLIVGVFADMDVAEVNDIADAAGLDLVQLSGEESPEYVRKVDRPVLKALHVAAETDAEALFERAGEYRAAGFLLDTASAAARGGTGQAFDWAVAAEAGRRLPFLLAGGLTPENVAGAIREVEPWGVDVSTGVEKGGKKDIEAIRAFIRAAKGVRV
jgi:phosphoribosylanthranilate isomerase